MKGSTDPRGLALHTLSRLSCRGEFLKESLAADLKRSALSPKDRALYTELVYGTVRMRKALDYVLKRFSRRPLDQLEARVLNNLRLAAYQILYLERVPDFAAVNEAVQLAHDFGHEGIAGFTNAVLRQVVKNKKAPGYPPREEDPPAFLSVKYSLPLWIAELFLSRLGLEEAEQLSAALNQPPELNVRVNTLKTDREALAAYFQSKGIVSRPGLYAPDVLKLSTSQPLLFSGGLRESHYYIQSEASALVSHALAPRPGWRIYDLCSAPGGKTTHLAQLMQDQGEIIAVDRDRRRLELVRENARKLGISSIKTLLGDASEDLGLKPADAVLVDAPCSGLGTLRGRPDLRWRRTAQELTELVPLQRSILSRGAAYLKPGGFLLYSTCTLNRHENEANALWFLGEHPQFSGFGLPEYFPPSHTDAPWYRTFWPHIHHLDGFFMALFQKGECEYN